MSTFKQKNVIKSYKLRLQEKLKTVTEETENATSFLNNCIEEFRQRVQHILQIKDEKCLSLYRNLNKDLENYSEKLFILQASFEEATEESDSSEDEEAAVKLSKTQPKTLSSLSSENENFSEVCPENSVQKHESLDLHAYPEKNVNPQRHCEENANLQRHAEENVNLQQHTDENVNLQKHTEENVNLHGHSERILNFRRYTEENLNLQRYVDENVYDEQYPEENKREDCHDEDGGNITEDDFYSLNSDNNVRNSSSFFSSQLPGSHNEHVSVNECGSTISFSQSSCYRSISSNISESLAVYKDNNYSVEPYNVEIKSQSSLESSDTTLVIHSPDLETQSHFSGTLSYIINPYNFWIQIENSHGYKFIFPKSENVHLNGLSSIKKGSYCLAPFKLQPFYYRAQSLSDGNSGRDLVKVLFIDHGSTQEISVCDLRPLPKSAYKVSAQAINCYLYGILPIGDSWSDKGSKRFKDFQNFCIDGVVKCKENLYGVQLVAKLSADLDEDFSVDVGQALCLDGLAVALNESQACDDNQLYESQIPAPLCNKTDSSLEVSCSYDTNAISNDSGVSVTSTYKFNQSSRKKIEKIQKVSEDYASSVAAKHDKDVLKLEPNAQSKDLISFESYNTLNNIQNSSEAVQSVSSSSSICSSCRNKNFCLHLQVPSPSLLFVVKDMVIVMLSHIVNPHEFYVNMAMESIDALDDLREQMTNLYESENNLCEVNIEDLTENMFCAGRFNADGYWYRVKILQFISKGKKKDQVLAQYIDYGNTAVIHCRDLRPLTSEFSKHPNFAIKCTLAGIKPNEDARSSDIHWKEDAINCFKKLTSYERCLTAQICIESSSNKINAYPVLLWDTEDSNDLLINAQLAEHGMAVFDSSLLDPVLTDKKVNNKSELNIDSWDPMLEEYYDTDNNYDYDDEDIEVMTTGYQAKDENYVCKYFSMQGRCPRGVNCNQKHLPLLESGITYDQEEVYCLDSVPIISENVNNTLVQVSAIITPTHFYAVLPFGCKTVDDIDNLVYKGTSYNEICNSEAKALFYDIDKHYSNTPFKENTTIALSCGTIVAAKRKWDEKWHRGRIVDVVGINKPAKVFFVDSGDYEWVPRKCIRTIEPQFLHTPFQAVQCSLHGIEPVGSNKNMSWSKEALKYFQDIVGGEILLAKIINRFGQVYHVSLTKTIQSDHSDVAQLLVSAGFAQFHKVTTTTDKKQTVYVPG